MAKIIEKLIIKNIIKILEIYKKSIKSDRYIFKNILERTIFYEIEYLIKIIKKGEKKNEI